MSNDVCVLGAGLAGLSFAHQYGKPVRLYEMAEVPGGLCRSYKTSAGIPVDVGPHIFFSRDEDALEYVKSLAPMNQLRRANRVMIGNRFTRYPFENDLYALSEVDCQRCVQSFLKRPENLEPTNLQEWFVKTFGEEMTATYFGPLNRKIWKCDLDAMDMQMVSRIPQPPVEHILRSARGELIEGYTHQLNHWYPKAGGTESIIQGLRGMLHEDTDLVCNCEVTDILLSGDRFTVVTKLETATFSRLVNTLPLPMLIDRIVGKIPWQVKDAAEKLRWNSLHVTTVTAKEDNLGAVFSVLVPDPRVCFHRLSRVGYLGDAYQKPGISTLLVETTYLPGNPLHHLTDTVSKMVVNDLHDIGILNKVKVIEATTRNFQHAYVLYDLYHRKNTDIVLSWLKSIGIVSIGRWGSWEYLNTDGVVAQSKKAVETL